MDRVQNKWSCVPTEIQILHNELNVSMQEAKDKVFTIYFDNKCLERVKEHFCSFRKYIFNMAPIVSVYLYCVFILMKANTIVYFFSVGHGHGEKWSSLQNGWAGWRGKGGLELCAGPAEANQS